QWNWNYTTVGTGTMITLPPDFSAFLASLNANQVEYLVVGGYAVMAHGYPRSTRDIDIWIDRTPTNIQRAIRAMNAFGWPADTVSATDLMAPNTIAWMGNYPLRIEVFTTIPGVDFAPCYTQRVLLTIDNIVVPFISLDDLKRNKQASGRHKDLDDLQNLPE